MMLIMDPSIDAKNPLEMNDYIVDGLLMIEDELIEIDLLVHLQRSTDKYHMLLHEDNA
jgi:hypothetical protein